MGMAKKNFENIFDLVYNQRSRHQSFIKKNLKIFFRKMVFETRLSSGVNYV